MMRTSLSKRFAHRARVAKAPSVVPQKIHGDYSGTPNGYFGLPNFEGKLGEDKLDLRHFLEKAKTEHLDRQDANVPPKIEKFLRDIKPFNTRYKKGGQQGEGYVGNEQLQQALQAQEPQKARYYSAQDLDELSKAADEVQNRMRVKVSKAYLDHCCNVPANATQPHPALKVVLPDAGEVTDLAGEADPSNQNSYSPLPGLLHKYEMILVYSAINCSSHCRYCYRSDLFNGISEKSKADMSKVYDYVKSYNEEIAGLIKNEGEMDADTGLWVHRATRENLIPIREALLSGGDPLTLPNSTLGRYLALLADGGVKQIRLGTKEFVFHPERFDADFFGMLDCFHEAYPDVNVVIVGHYVHPFELLNAKTDESGAYTYDINESYVVRSDLKQPLEQIQKRTGWLSHVNQFPIVAGINDNAAAIRLILVTCAHMGISIHNIYACREIIGNAHFRQDNDIARQYALVETAKLSLSGLQNHARLIMSTEYGKVEVVGADGEKLYMRLNRFIHGSRQSSLGNSMTVDLSKLGGSFFWLSDDVIESGALCKRGVELVNGLKNQSASKVKAIKDECGRASAGVEEESSTVEAPALAQPVEITIGDNTLTVDMQKEKTNVTLAHVLAREGIVEAACKCSLSCSSCVGWVQSSSNLPSATDDELDVVELHGSEASDDAGSSGLRATCKIPLQPGARYTFSPAATFA